MYLLEMKSMVLLIIGIGLLDLTKDWFMPGTLMNKGTKHLLPN